MVFRVELSAEFEKLFLKKFCVEHFSQIELKVGYPDLEFWQICRFENWRLIVLCSFLQTKCTLYIHIWYHFNQEPLINTLFCYIFFSELYFYMRNTQIHSMLHVYIIVNHIHTIKYISEIKEEGRNSKCTRHMYVIYIIAVIIIYLYIKWYWPNRHETKSVTCGIYMYSYIQSIWKSSYNKTLFVVMVSVWFY